MRDQDEIPTRLDLSRPPPWVRSLVKQMADLQAAMEATLLHLMALEWSALADEGARAALREDVDAVKARVSALEDRAA